MEYVPQVIDVTPDYVQHLRSLVHPQSDLQKRGYIFDQLSETDLEKKRRCSRCSKCELGGFRWIFYLFLDVLRKLMRR